MTPATSTFPWAGRDVCVQGTFTVGVTTMDGYVVDIYQLRVEHLAVVR